MTPFVRKTKVDIIRTGLALGVPYEETWSCYQNNDTACGVCSSCHYRREAFRELGLEDPIAYER
jgi:7-cyano-7-deazaguanine synthase